MMKEGNRARGGGALTRACNFLFINLPLFDVGFDISTSGNDTTLCTGSYRYFFFWLALRGISIYADMTLAAIIYLGMSSRSCLMSTSGLICFWKNWSAS